VYELKRDIETCFKGVHVRTNEDGLRAPMSFAREKPADVFRIVLLGDSQAFGWGVRFEDTVGEALRALLEQASDRRVEVINTGVPGYNAAQEAAHLAAYGIHYQPDCVLVLFIGNDLELPRLLLNPRPASGSKGWHLVHALRGLRSFFEPPAREPPWYRMSEDFSPDQVPAEYQQMVGLGGYRRALQSIADTARPSGAAVVNFADYPRDLEAAGLSEFQASLGIEHQDFDFPWKLEYWLSQQDQHLNAAGNLELARRIAAALMTHPECHPLGGVGATPVESGRRRSAPAGGDRPR
jgi:hypothetical protein